MADPFIETFLSSFDDSIYPMELLQEFELMECMANNDLGETLLIKEKKTGELFVAKCYPDNNFASTTSESDLLRKINHEGLPVYAGEYKNEKMSCVVRTHSPGQSLDQWVLDNPVTKQKALSIILQLCEILHYLHSQSPAIIHRDIKPQNVIIDEEGKITLIDFGISRTYNEAAQADTLCFGTKHYAAPEQYGYSQTDGRSDIFSLGVLLCWLLTGSVDTPHAANHIADTRLQRVVKKCTAFSPEDRYQNAIQVMKELSPDTNRRRITTGLFLGLFIAAVVLLSIMAPSIKNWFPGGVRFREPLLETAVRQVLNISEQEVLTEADLLLVKELYVYGDHIADKDSYSVYANAFATNDGMIKRGMIESLQDLQQLKNLQKLSLAYQNISDLTPLAELDHLEELDLRHNPIFDISPLSESPILTNLILFGTDISDLSSLTNCRKLTLIDVGGTRINSAGAFDGLTSLQIIAIRKAPLQDLDGIDQLTLLEEIYLSDTNLVNMTPLLELPNLRVVEVSESMRDAAEAVQSRAKFNFAFQNP